MRVIIFWDIVSRKRSSLKIQRGWININKKLIRLSISAGDGGGIHIMFYRRRRVKACYRLRCLPLKAELLCRKNACVN